MSRQTHHRQTVPAPYPRHNRPLQKLLSGFALVFFGASMMLPFKDDSVGLSAVFTVLGHPLRLPYWLFPICTLGFMRLIFRLHDLRLPILKAGALLLGMVSAVSYLYFNHDGITVGAGAALWLASGYLLMAAAIRWRHPTGGILFSFSALAVAAWLCVWAQSLFKDGNGGHIWQNGDTATPAPPLETASAPAAPQSELPPPADNADTPVVAGLDGLERGSLIAVERDSNLYNPWSDSRSRDCVSNIKRNFPVLLPPRFIEDGYEWHNYEHGSGVCNNLIYIGNPTNAKNPAFHYKITQDRRSNIYLVFSNARGKPLFNETFTINSEQNDLSKSDYQKKLNAGFAKMVDAKGTEQIDNEHVFAKVPAPAGNEILSRGCGWKPISNQPNTFQWNTGRINWRGQNLMHPQNFCSKNLLAVAHLTPKEGSTQPDDLLAIKLFRGKDLKPVECGALALKLKPADTQAWLNGQLQADSVGVEPDNNGGCLKVTVKLNDGRKLSSDLGG